MAGSSDVTEPAVQALIAAINAGDRPGLSFTRHGWAAAPFALLD